MNESGNVRRPFDGQGQFVIVADEVDSFAREDPAYEAEYVFETAEAFEGALGLTAHAQILGGSETEYDPAIGDRLLSLVLKVGERLPEELPHVFIAFGLPLENDKVN